MNRYESYLREVRMTGDEAAKILGLSDKATAEDVKTAYRKASMANHPDRGGSVEKMQDVNAAYAVLKNGYGGGAAKSYQSYAAEAAARREEYAAMCKNAKDYFVNTFNTTAFVDYFEKLIGKKFTVDAKSSSNDSYAHAIWTFTSEDSETWFKVSLSAYFATIKQARDSMLGGRPDMAPIPFYAEVDFMTNNRKQTIKKRDYSTKVDAKVFTDPEILFPKDKIAKGVKNTTSKFARRHFDTALKAKFPTMSIQGSDYFFKTSAGMEIHMFRTTFLRQAGYSINTIRAADKTKGRPSLFTIPETEAALILLVDLLKSIDNLPTVAAVEAQINARKAAFAAAYPE